MKYILMVSRNLGITYTEDYGTNDRYDQKLLDLIEKSKKEGLRYYLVGDETVVCPIHVMNLDFQGDNIVRTGGYVGNIEDKISRLRHKFCK